jgi:hypothetical protein
MPGPALPLVEPAERDFCRWSAAAYGMLISVMGGLAGAAAGRACNGRRRRRAVRCTPAMMTPWPTPAGTTLRLSTRPPRWRSRRSRAMGPPCIWSPSASVRLPKPAPPLAWCTRRCAHGIPSTSVCLSEAAPQQLVQLLCPSSARTRPAARSVHLPESFSRARLFLLGLSILRHAQEAERARRMRRRGHGGGAPAGDRHRGAPLAFYPPSSDVFLGTLQPGAAARPAHGDDPVYDGCDDDGLIDAGAGHGFHAHPAVRGCLSAQSFMSVRPPTGRSACPLSVCPSGLAWRADVWCGEGAAGVWLSGRWVPRAQEGGGYFALGTGASQVSIGRGGWSV